MAQLAVKIRLIHCKCDGQKVCPISIVLMCNLNKRVTATVPKLRIENNFSDTETSTSKDSWQSSKHSQCLLIDLLDKHGNIRCVAHKEVIALPKSIGLNKVWHNIIQLNQWWRLIYNWTKCCQDISIHSSIAQVCAKHSSQLWLWHLPRLCPVSSPPLYVDFFFF